VARVLTLGHFTNRVYMGGFCVHMGDLCVYGGSACAHSKVFWLSSPDDLVEVLILPRVEILVGCSRNRGE
jgi:hypothetical protein